MTAKASTLLAIAALTALTACSDEKAQPPVVGVKATLADSAEQVMYQVRHILTGNGIRRGELFADTAYAFDESSRLEFRKVRIEFNTAQGTKNATLTANRGIHRSRFGQFDAFGNVVVVTTDGRKLTSQELKYNQGANEISTDSAFVFDDGKSVQRGIGLRTDPDLKRIQVLKAASGVTRRVPLPQSRP